MMPGKKMAPTINSTTAPSLAELRKMVPVFETPKMPAPQSTTRRYPPQSGQGPEPSVAEPPDDGTVNRR